MPGMIITSDVHTHFGLLADLVAKTGATLGLQCGDLGVWYPDEDPHHRSRYDHVEDLPDSFPIPFCGPHGNHDSRRRVDSIRTGKDPAASWLTLPRPGEVQLWGGYRVACLSGHWSPKRYAQTSSLIAGLSDRHSRCHYSHEDVRAILDGPDFDILLSHEATTGLGVLRTKVQLEGQPLDLGRPEIREILDAKQPRFAFSGHHHCLRRAKIGRTEAYAVPRPQDGYLKIVDGYVHAFLFT